MTDQERQLIEGLASRIRNAPASEVDRDADAAIRTGIGSRPDALYILTQTVLVQEMALNQAHAQMDEMKKRAEQPAERAANFLGAQAVSQSAPPAPGQPSWWGRSAGTVPQQATSAAPPPLPPQYAPPQYAAPPYAAPAPAGGGFSSFMKTAATAAAGVVAGEVAFSALSGLFGQHSGGGMGGGMMGSGGMGGGSSFLGGGGSGVSPASETIVNNYYGDSAAQGTAAAPVFSDADAPDYQAADNSTPDDAEDNASDDSTDESSADDSGSYDDGGGGDSGGDDS